MYVPAPFENLNKTTLSHSTQARHRCELALRILDASQTAHARGYARLPRLRPGLHPAGRPGRPRPPQRERRLRPDPRPRRRGCTRCHRRKGLLLPLHWLRHHRRAAREPSGRVRLVVRPPLLWERADRGRGCGQVLGWRRGADCDVRRGPRPQGAGRTGGRRGGGVQPNAARFACCRHLPRGGGQGRRDPEHRRHQLRPHRASLGSQAGAGGNGTQMLGLVQRGAEHGHARWDGHLRIRRAGRVATD
mmetsp:Transcript_33111/g.106510  ORF Transcript_33111/g.106510 Transcript_33111/m.106510 type:complete len:247 (-) Transcript_33111:85-825(-)